MATQDVTAVPRGLRKRGRTWHISRTINGRVVRVTTNCSDLEAAVQVYRRLETGVVTASKVDWWQGEIQAAQRGEDSILTGMVARAKNRAKNRDRECTLTVPQILALAEQSGGRCAVSGLQFSPKVVGVRTPFVPSLDRIDSARGYEIGNCRLVCLIVNYAMSDFGETALHQLARAMAIKDLQAQIPV